MVRHVKRLITLGMALSFMLMALPLAAAEIPTNLANIPANTSILSPAPEVVPEASTAPAITSAPPFDDQLRTLLAAKGAFIENPDHDHVTFDFFNKKDRELVESASFTLKEGEVTKQSKRFKVKVAIPGDVPKVVVLQGRYTEWVTVPVLTSRLKAGEIIAASDITMSNVPITEIHHDTVRDQALLLGKTSRHGLPASRALSKNELISPNKVNKNDTVTLLYKNGVLKLEEKGAIALEGGAIGDQIRVKKQNNTVISGIIEESQLVKIPTR